MDFMKNSSLSIERNNCKHQTNRLPIFILSCLIITLIWFVVQNNKKQPIKLVVYAFSTMEEALNQGIFPVFEQTWDEQNTRELAIEGVFGPSVSLVKQINLGAPVDVAIVSNQRHFDWIKIGGWAYEDTEPILIASTPLVIVTRMGNPNGVRNFSDLTKQDLQLLHTDPRSSGVAEWAILAEYGSAFLETGDHTSAEIQVKNIWQNVRVMGPSARASLNMFDVGACDALVTYEQDALLALKQGSLLEIITPPRTIMARHFAVIINKNVTSSEKTAAEGLLAFILSDKGQQILGEYFFRPAVYEDESFPKLVHPFTEEDLGGWDQAYDRLIEKYWQNEIEPGLKLESATTILGNGE